MIHSTVLQLPPKAGNPRNSEGDFISLRNGQLLFAYTHFTGGDGDHATAHIAGRYSSDGGLTWTAEDVVLARDAKAQNLMSVSFLRLEDDRIALFCARKNSLTDCRPIVHFSDDEAQTWSAGQVIIPESEIGYYVLNNARVIQMKSGRLVAPVSRHDTAGGHWTGASNYGTIMCYLSDDGGLSWRRSKTQRDGSPENGKKEPRIMLQEPGVIELKDGRLMMYCRTHSGCQFLSQSQDGGESWSLFKASTIISPCSPASMKRIPDTGHLLMVWNDHKGIEAEHKDKRTPLCVAISRDEGLSWEHELVLEDNPHGWYCYTAIHFTNDHVLLGYCAGDRRENNGLARTQITRIPLKCLYSDVDGMTMKN